ncbi:MAG TPA: hypothetical protein P5048_01575 [Chlamydiales bacterium]|nr:hypothetical protein [Chlamydiales bacterium]
MSEASIESPKHLNITDRFVKLTLDQSSKNLKTIKETAQKVEEIYGQIQELNALQAQINRRIATAKKGDSIDLNDLKGPLDLLKEEKALPENDTYHFNLKDIQHIPSYIESKCASLSQRANLEYLPLQNMMNNQTAFFNICYQSIKNSERFIQNIIQRTGR